METSALASTNLLLRKRYRLSSFEAGRGLNACHASIPRSHTAKIDIIEPSGRAGHNPSYPLSAVLPPLEHRWEHRQTSCALRNEWKEESYVLFKLVFFLLFYPAYETASDVNITSVEEAQEPDSSIQLSPTCETKTRIFRVCRLPLSLSL